MRALLRKDLRKAAWLVCRVLEPRRMAPRVREEPRGVPAWAPIADRAGV